MKIYNHINGSCLLINDNLGCVNDYYQYIVSILIYIINKNRLSINIILGDNDYNFSNKNKTIKININYEHTLVKEGGRGVPIHTLTGEIEYNKNYKYLVRIEPFQKLNASDIVIDYSIPNIHNVNTCGHYNNFSNKHIYISPCIYQNIYTTMNNRNINTLTTFININEPRRKKLLENIKKSNLKHNNVNNCFDKTELQKLYQTTKVIVNIHQTEHHDTFEELRCLPALQNGVIVVAENSPLNHLIPYNDLIIWSDYDNIIEKTKEVLNNFEKYHSLIFTKKNIDILKNLDMENKNEIEKKLSLDILKNLDMENKNEIEKKLSLDLKDYAIKYGLDKCIQSGCHNYIPAYTELFNNIRYNVNNILEIGIGSLENGQMGGLNGPLASRTNYKTGNSLKCWEEYFPLANIYGIDIYSHPELNKNRIKTFVANQNSEQDLQLVMDKIDTKLDIIIDDGSHMGEHQVFSFIHLNKHLSDSGIYVIEDVQPPHINGFKNLSIFPADFKEYINKNFNVEYFDTRNTTGRSDDFIVSFTKK